MNDQDELKLPDELKKEDSNQLEDPSFPRCTSLKAYKNLLGISFSFFIIFSVYLAILSLQSSINEENGLGLTAVCALYFSFFLSCFYSAAVISIMGTKYTIVLAYIVMAIYTVCNFYPSWYTLVPGSIMLGLIYGPLWASQSVHITSIAHQYALQIGKKSRPIVFQFFGIYVFCVNFGYLPANIVSSVVLLNGRSPNTSVVESSLGDVCNITDVANLDRIYLYVLLSIYVVFDVIAVVMVILLVDRLVADGPFSSMSKVFDVHIKTPIISTLKLMLSWKMNMVVVMMVLNGYSVSFVFGIFTKVYISNCIGVYWIGFCHVAFGIASAFSAIANGYLVKIIPQFILVFIGGAVNIGTIIFLLIWKMYPSYFITFVVLLLLGYSGGIWNSLPLSLVGTILSHKDKQCAFSYCRMGMALGFIIGFVCALVTNAQAMLWIDLGLVTVAMICYSILIIVSHQLLPCCFTKQ